MEHLSLVAYDLLDDQVEALYRDGYVYLPQVLSSDEIGSLKERMAALTAIPESFDSQTDPIEHGFMNKSINNVFNRHSHFLKFLDYPGVIELEEEVLGNDCHCIGMTSWMTGPGRPDQTLHSDGLALELPEEILADSRVRLPIFITTAHYYLDDLTEELGPTAFVPGSHLSGRRPNGDTTWKGQGEQAIMCKAGDVVIFRCEVWHKGTANSSDQTRYLLQVHYAKRMITQKYPPYLNRFQFDEDILDKATERQLRLLGNHKPSNYD